MRLLRYIPQFDYLRGIAVLLVLLFHASHHVESFPMATVFSLGWTGVDLFFVLSGFLITRILLVGCGEEGYFRNFYGRRLLRIWPLYFALLIIVHILLTTGANLGGSGSDQPIWAFVLFVQNLVIGHDMTGPLSVTWSLAIEEQFYLIWPFLILLLSQKAVQWVAAGIVLCSPFVRLLVELRYINISIYFNTLTHLDGIALGSFLAVWLPNAKPETVRKGALIILPFALLIVTLVDRLSVRFTAITLVAASVVCLSLFAHLENRFLAYTGRISYGLYLTHSAIFGLAAKPAFRRHYPQSHVLNDIFYLLTGLALSYGVASLSWFGFESQIMRAKKWFNPAQRETGSRSLADTTRSTSG